MQWEKKMLMELDEENIQTLILYAQHVKAVSIQCIIINHRTAWLVTLFLQ